MVSVLIFISYFKSSHLVLTYFFICFRVKKKTVPTAKTKSKVIFFYLLFFLFGGGCGKITYAISTEFEKMCSAGFTLACTQNFTHCGGTLLHYKVDNILVIHQDNDRLQSAHLFLHRSVLFRCNKISHPSKNL